MKNPLSVLPERFRRRMPTTVRALAEMEHEMDRWLQNTSPWSDDIMGCDFSPLCDFRDTGKNYIVQLDIPGAKKDEVKIEIEDNRLTVSGERSQRKESQEGRLLLSEASYGSFLRSFVLPSPVDEGKVDAHFEDGVLTIKIPKSETSKSKMIKIH
ncbi:MAG: Hsp20/alpha crystallin family protein [Bdellovibrionales bacterium]|nr:Hsp20/alpha crystallin family protein [Bdellovibrionales bacterium]